jgi:enoyl-CoA hydratase/carnithine racemase
VADGVGVITLNRPEVHNAMDDESSEAFASILDQVLSDSTVRAVLIRGAGRSFCSGRDTTMLGHRAHEESDYHFVLRAQQSRLKILESTKPFVAAIRGGAIGGGAELALSCDLRIAANDLKLALPEINYGILPDTGGTQYLANLVGTSRAKYMVMTGARIDAETALAWGAVDFVVTPEEVDARAMEIAKEMASKPPLCLALAKTMIDQSAAGAIRSGIAQELMAQSYLFSTEDYREARAALREKRKPSFQGR